MAEPDHMPHPCDTLRGIITVLNTPFRADGSVDYDALAAHARYALDAGVVGFLAPALAGEVGKLAFTERLDIVRTLLETVADRVPVIGCATADNPLDRCRTAEALSALGCAGIMAALPYADETTFQKEAEELTRAISGFFMLQDWAPSGYGIPTEALVRLWHALPAFQCLKIEVAPAGVKYSEILAATDGRLHVSGGWAVTQMIEGLDRGVHAFMPTGLHRTYVNIYRLYQSGQRAEARNLFQQLLPIIAFSNQHLDISIHFFKRLLWRQGIYPTPLVRPPALAFDAIHGRMADELIEIALMLESWQETMPTE